MDQNDKLVQLIRKQIDIEKEHVRRISGMEKKVGNAAARLLLLEMRFDSKKHAEILKGILQTMRGIPPTKSFWEHQLESYVDSTVVKRSLEAHVKMETDVLAHVEEEMRSTKDEGVRLLLQHIAEDEKKHHKILNEMMKNLYKIT